MRGRRDDPRRIGRRRRRGSRAPRLERLESRRLLAVFTVTTAEDSGSDRAPEPGSLRDAILRANANVGPDVIEFRIPGNGIQTLSIVDRQLPTILDRLTIDGTTQPGYDGSRPWIVLSGTGLPAGNTTIDGLELNSPTTIRALTISSFPGHGIRMNVGGNVVEGSYIGLDPTGSLSAGNGLDGILVDGSASNLIGGTPSGLGNVISGNHGAGIRITSTSAGFNEISGNRIGLDSTGSVAVGNGQGGVVIEGGVGNVVGGASDARRNVISGNTGSGIRLTGNTAANIIANNHIGTNLAGTGPIANTGAGITVAGSGLNQIGQNGAGNLISGNGRHGVELIGGNGNVLRSNRIGTDVDGSWGLIFGNGGSGGLIDGADDTQIGGHGPGAGNFIASNAGDGISILGDALGNRIHGNTIGRNGGLGIDLAGDGVTPNDPGDLDTGPNRLQNTPILDAARTAAHAGLDRTFVGGALRSTPSSSFTLEFFANDPMAGDQGQVPLGTTTVETDAAGLADFRLTLPARTLVGQRVTATATDAAGNTSEFSPGVAVVAGAVSDLVLTIDDDNDPSVVGRGVEYTLTVRNLGPGAAENARVVSRLAQPLSGTFVAAEILGGAAGAVDLTGTRVAADLGRLVPGAEVRIRVRVEPIGPGAITHVGEVLSDTIDAQPGDNTAAEVTTVAEEADLAVRILPEPASVVVGGDLEYAIEVLNHGPGPASGVVVAATISPDATFVAAEAPQGTSHFDPATRTVTIVLGGLPAGEPLVTRIVVRPTGPDWTSIDVLASGNENIRVVGPDDNDVASRVVEVLPAADLGVTVAVAPEMALTGQVVIYTVDVVSNAGPSDATNAVLTATLPAGMTFVSSSGAPAAIVGSVVTFDLGHLDHGLAGPRVTIEALVGPDAATPLAFRAEIASGVHDPDPGNNVATATTPLNPADIGLTLEAPGSADLGEPFRYLATIRNHGPATAGTVRFLLNLPGGLDFQPADSTPGLAFDEATRQITLHPTGLPAGGSTTVAISAIPRQAGIRHASAGAIAIGQLDPATGDNIRVATTDVNATDLGVAFEGVPASPMTIGDRLRLVVRADNHGRRAGTGGTIAVPIPPNATVEAAEPIAGVREIVRDGDAIVALLDDLPGGATAAFALTFVPTSGGHLSLTATVAADQLDASPANDNAALKLPLREPPGVLQFRQTVLAAVEGDQVVVTVERAGGSGGAVAAFYEVTGGTARPGVDYTPTGGVVIFLEGETTKTFTVPLNRDGQDTGDRTVGLRLTDIGFGALGAVATATIAVREADLDRTGPIVADVRTSGGTQGVGAVTMFFSEPLDPALAADPANYRVIAGATRLSPAGNVPVGEVTYDPASRSVRVVPARPLPSGPLYQVIVSGEGPGGVADLAGNRIDGDGDGTPGGDFVASLVRGSNLSYVDRDGDTVYLRLTGGGVIEQVRGTDGTVFHTRVLDALPGRSVLSGLVLRSSFSGDGVTSLGALGGVGSFGGGAVSRLTSPPFHVTNGPLPSASDALRFGRGPFGPFPQRPTLRR